MAINAPNSSQLRQLLIMSIPTMLITVSRTMMQFVDFLFVSQLGTDAIAALFPASITAWIIIGFGMGAVSIVGTFAAQSFGRGDHEEGASYLWQAIYVGLGFSILAEFARFGLVPLLASYGHAPSVLTLEISFADAILYSTCPSIIAFALQSYLVAIQRPWYAVYAAVISNLVNVLFDYLLVFGNHGFPNLGIAGAAYATVLASFVQMFVALYFVCSPAMRAKFATTARMRINLQKAFTVLKLGAPVGVTWILDIVAWTVFTAFLVGQFGTAELAASNICMQFLHLSFMPAIGVGQAVASLVGESIGARRFNDAIRFTNIGTLLAMVWMGAIGLVVWFGGGFIVSHLDPDPAVILAGAAIFRLAAIYQLFDAVAIVTVHALRAAGDTMFPTFVSFVANWFVFVLGGYLMAKYLPELKSSGPWIMGTVMINGIGMVFRFRFVQGRWKRIDVFQMKKKAAAAQINVEPVVVHDNVTSF